MWATLAPFRLYSFRPSDKFPKKPESRDSLSESLAFHDREVFLNGFGWVLEVLSLTPGGSTYDRGGDVQQVLDELVGVLSIDPLRSQFVFGEVL